MEPDSLRTGSRVDRYEIEVELGSGGFGSVYRARHAVTGRAVALKVLRPELARSAEVLERFLQEARAATTIGHRHIVQVWDAGQTAEGLAFLAMELLEGEDLADRLERRGRLSVQEALAIADEVLEGLAAAHGAGIVHRDLKPANVFLARVSDAPDTAPRESVKLLDFGISKVHRPDTPSSLTRTGMVLGTPHYMAPEQFRGAKDVDARADLYSACVMFYEMFTGRTPHDADSYEGLLLRIHTEGPVPLRELAPEVPAPLAAAVEQGLARDPDARWPSAEALRRALHGAYPNATPISSRNAPTEDAFAPTMATPEAHGSHPLTRASAPLAETPAPHGSTPLAAPRRSRWLLVGALGALGAVLAAIVVIAALGLGTAGSAPTPSGEPSVVGTKPEPRPKPAPEPAPAAGKDVEPASTDSPSEERGAGEDNGDEPEPAGPPVERPPPETRMTEVRATVDVLGDVPQAAAEALVERGLARLERCRGGEDHRVRVQLLLGMNGRIAIAQPDPNRDHGETDVARCAARALRGAGPVDDTEMGGILHVEVVLPRRGG